MSAVAVAAAFDRDADILVLDAEMPREALLGQIRGSRVEFTLIVVGAELAPVDRATMFASIGPLAIELGPDRRIGAIEVRAGARESDIVALARFLSGAESTTGQVLAVSG